MNNCSILVINRRNHGKPCVQQGGGPFACSKLSAELSLEAFTDGEWMFSVDHLKPNTNRHMVVQCEPMHNTTQCEFVRSNTETTVPRYWRKYNLCSLLETQINRFSPVGRTVNYTAHDCVFLWQINISVWCDPATDAREAACHEAYGL